jgi:ZIP family zinc transporter
MLTLSVVDLFLPNVHEYGLRLSVVVFLLGVGLVFALSACIAATGLAEMENPWILAPEATQDTAKARRRRQSALLTVLALALHNAPEGVLVAVTASQPDQRHVHLMVLSVGLHNIPEGVSAAVSIFNATSSRLQAVLGGNSRHFSAQDSCSSLICVPH